MCGQNKRQDAFLSLFGKFFNSETRVFKSSVRLVFSLLIINRYYTRIFLLRIL